MKPIPLPRQLLENARDLRRRATDAEDTLWKMLRGRRFGGFKFRRQVPIPPYILDFYCPEARVAIELDGGQHTEPDRAIGDEKRSAVLAQKGIRVLRVWNDEFLRETEAFAQLLWENLNATRSPHPDPLPQAGEGDEL